MEENGIKANINKSGIIEAIEFANGLVIPFRDDEHAGPQLFVSNNDKKMTINLNCDENELFIGYFKKIKFTLKYTISENMFIIEINIENSDTKDFICEKAGLELGIDSYMESYPEWDNCFFPTLLRCEKTHFWGYMMSPMGKVIAIASKDPIASWSLEYNKVNYDGEISVGHRIYTVCLDLLNTNPLPERHPQKTNRLSPGEKKTFRILLAPALNENDAVEKAISFTDAAIIKAEKYTIEFGEKLKFYSDGKILLISPDGKEIGLFNENGIFVYENINEYGIWKIKSIKNNKESEALVYVRQSWSWYLDKARDACIAKPQKASTHTESWYGYFSAFLARKYFRSKEKDEMLEKEFNIILEEMYDLKNAEPKEETIPGRIQNSACMISLLVDAFESTGIIHYLEFASRLGDWLITCQAKDGSYRTKSGQHYSCVVYPVKSMLELYLVETKQEKRIWKNKANRHYNSAQAAIDNLVNLLDDISTEGEQTFEDGMIACESLQLGYFALLQSDKEKQEKYYKASKYLLTKHRCLEQNQVPDCRMRGGTLRFWETMYDVLISDNMMNSPHGWTSWKNYATYYLYRLSEEIKYLKDTMDTIGACMQSVDLKTGNLRWSFVVDPYIKAKIWSQRDDGECFGELKEKIIGEQYIEMISDWWRAPDRKIVFGYAFPEFGRVDGKYKGGCCDNDVHEHFKCLEEIALTRAFVHQVKNENEYETYNCIIKNNNNTLIIYPSEVVVNSVCIHLNYSTKVKIVFNTDAQSKLCLVGFTEIFRK